MEKEKSLEEKVLQEQYELLEGLPAGSKEAAMQANVIAKLEEAQTKKSAAKRANWNNALRNATQIFTTALLVAGTAFSAMLGYNLGNRTIDTEIDPENPAYHKSKGFSFIPKFFK